MIHRQRPLTDAQIDTLRSVLVKDRRLGYRAVHALHRRGLVRVVGQCRSGCCRSYIATPAGATAVRERDDRTVS